jgi:hypothetical protein
MAEATRRPDAASITTLTAGKLAINGVAALLDSLEGVEPAAGSAAAFFCVGR